MLKNLFSRAPDNTSAPKFFFIHIPKTAGTSVRQLLEKNYRRQLLTLYDADELRDYARRDPEFLKKFQAKIARNTVVYGHYAFGIHAACQTPGKYLTIMRDPVERVLSYYNFQAFKKDMPHHQAIQNGMSLAEFLEKAPQTSNHMAKMIAGLKKGEDTVLVDTALENIERHFAFVGLTERLEVSLTQIGEIMQWKRLSKIPFSNQTSNKAITCIDAELEELIRDRNQADLQLYQYVENRFFSKDALDSVKRQ